ncbi:MAG: MFS transporter [Paracoccaceae bacterium]
MRGSVVVFLILAVGQIAGWGAVGFVAVVARGIAADLEMDLPAVFLGSSLMFAVMGLAAPGAGRGFRRFGPRRVMAAGAVTIGCGLGTLAAAPGPVVYFAGWGLTGAGGAMFLTTAAYAYLADVADAAARGRIGTLMLVTGLAGSVFWPMTGLLDHLLGWRGAAAIYGVTMAFVIAPLTLFGLPETGAGGTQADTGRDAVARRGRAGATGCSC